MSSVFTYVSGDERHAAVIRKTNLLGGLNQLLVKNGHKEVSTVAKAIKICEEKGLLSASEVARAKKINSEGNDGNHEWDMTKYKRNKKNK
jgi:hypothetical protein